MKTCLLMLCLFGISISFVHAELPRDKRIFGNDINPVILKGAGYVKPVRLRINQLTRCDLLIIDNKIFGGKAAVNFKLNRDSLVFIRSIIDSTSKSGINRIFFYESKRKP